MAAVDAGTGPSVPYSWTVEFPMRYYTRTEGDSGGNTTVVLTGHAYYDPTWLGVFDSVIVCTLPEAELGLAAAPVAAAKTASKSSTTSTSTTSTAPASAAA